MTNADLTRASMIRIFTIGLFLFPLMTSKAQQTVALSSSNFSQFNNLPVSPLLRQSSYQETNFRPLKSTFRIPGEKQKKIGSTMMAIGGAMLVGGIILYAGSDKTPTKDSVLNNYGTYDVYYDYDPKFTGGILLMVAGTGISVPGVLIWRKGVKKFKQYMIEQERLSFYYHGTGATVTYRF
jgi:hypothetical protein